jgi:hypothetical protein
MWISVLFLWRDVDKKYFFKTVFILPIYLCPLQMLAETFTIDVLRAVREKVGGYEWIPKAVKSVMIETAVWEDCIYAGSAASKPNLAGGLCNSPQCFA